MRSTSTDYVVGCWCHRRFSLRVCRERQLHSSCSPCFFTIVLRKVTNSCVDRRIISLECAKHRREKGEKRRTLWEEVQEILEKGKHFSEIFWKTWEFFRDFPENENCTLWDVAKHAGIILMRRDIFYVDTPLSRWRRKIKWSAEGKQWGRGGCDYLVQNREDGLAFCEKNKEKGRHTQKWREKRKWSRKKRTEKSHSIFR